MRLDRTFAEQIAEIGLDLRAFDYVAFSHMHFDHVGVANEIQGATLLIQEPEFNAAFANEVTLRGFDRELYRNLQDDRWILAGEHDVFGDGRVRILPAPGHTPGHQVLFLDLPATGPVVLSGDLYHFRVSREHRIVPDFNVDAAMTLESMNRVEDFLSSNGAELRIEHELAWFEQLEKAPSFYE